MGPRNGQPNTLSHKNVTSIAIEVPIRCITQGGDPVIAGWTTSSLPSSRLPASVVSNSYTWYDASGHAYTQISRLANPLVNELVIGLPDKDRFNGSNPRDDAQFDQRYQSDDAGIAECAFRSRCDRSRDPANDLVTAFLIGLKGVNQPQSVHPAELMRLNTSLPRRSQRRKMIWAHWLAIRPDFRTAGGLMTMSWTSNYAQYWRERCAALSVIVDRRRQIRIMAHRTPTGRSRDLTPPTSTSGVPWIRMIRTWMCFRI